MKRLMDRQMGAPMTAIKEGLLAQIRTLPVGIGASLVGSMSLQRDSARPDRADFVWSSLAGIERLRRKNAGLQRKYWYRRGYNGVNGFFGRPFGEWQIPGIVDIPSKIPTADPWQEDEKTRGVVKKATEEHFRMALESLLHALMRERSVDRAMREAGIDPNVFAMTRLATFCDGPRQRRSGRMNNLTRLL